MNIAMIGHKRIPSREGGIEIVVEELSTRMVEVGHSVTCFNRSGHHISGKEFDKETISEYKGINLKTVWTINRKGLAAMTSSLFGSILTAFGKYDVVHFHAEGPSAMVWIPKLFSKRCVVTIHGLDWQRAKWGGFASQYIKFGERMAAKYADEIIVLSKSVQKYFLETYGRKTVIIPNGVSRPVLRKARLIKTQYGLDKDEYILFLGRLVPEKGITYLIEAFKEVKTDKKLVIAGGTSDTNSFFQEVKRLSQNDNRIMFTGFVQGEILEELYTNTFIYVLPSDLEGMPLSLLEAMSYGNCCITSDIPECAEVVEDKAFLFEKSNINDLKKILQYICDHPEAAKRVGSIAADYICQKYNWDDVVEQTLKLYQN